MARLNLDPSLSWGDIAMSISLVFGGVLAFATLSARVDVHDERIASNNTHIEAVQVELRRHIEQETIERNALKQELRAELREINAKLDKLIERELNDK